MLLKTASSLLFILLITSTLSSNVPNVDVLDLCSESPFQVSTQEAAQQLVNTLTAGLIQNTETKNTLLATPYELEKAREKLVRCTEGLMKFNQFKALESLITEVLDPLDLDLSNDMRMIGNSIKKELDAIVNVAHAKRNTQVVVPAFQWLQSKTNLFLQIKFAHRHDAPGCLEVKNEKIEFTGSTLTFSAFGVQGMQPMQFKLNLNFFKDILPEESTWNLESVGRLFVNVTKAEPDVWVYLLKDNEKLPQMRLWWEMKDNYKEDMKVYDRLLEEQEDVETTKKSKKKKKDKVETDDSQAPAAELTSNDAPAPDAVQDEL